MREDVQMYRQHLIDIGLGKRVHDSIYVHVCAIEGTKTGDWVQDLALQNGILEFNLVKLSSEWDGGSVSVMWYPRFWEDAFPRLDRSWTIKPSGVTSRHFRRNHPILHRKETFLRPEHERVPEFKALTEQAEALGLFGNLTRIGWSTYWERLLESVGYRAEGNTLVPV